MDFVLPNPKLGLRSTKLLSWLMVPITHTEHCSRLGDSFNISWIFHWNTGNFRIPDYGRINLADKKKVKPKVKIWEVWLKRRAVLCRCPDPGTTKGAESRHRQTEALAPDQHGQTWHGQTWHGQTWHGQTWHRLTDMDRQKRSHQTKPNWSCIQLLHVVTLKSFHCKQQNKNIVDKINNTDFSNLPPLSSS